MEYFTHCTTKEQLEQEHKRLVVKLHPDRNSHNPNATAEFQEMQAQYEERLAELNGDYSKSRRGRERRERERKQQEKRKVEEVISQARKNMQKSFSEWKAGDYVYAKKACGMPQASWQCMRITGNDLLHLVVQHGVKDECVVKIEHIFDCSESSIMHSSLSEQMNDDGTFGIYGGRETIQSADPENGIFKKQSVAKVVMFRSKQCYMMGNPNGDRTISEYYMPVDYETMFSSAIGAIMAKLAHEQQEKQRAEKERMERLHAEQQPLIEQWSPKLIRLSEGLTRDERNSVALSNLKTMLKQKFQSTKFSVRTDRRGFTGIRWEDGPTIKEVLSVSGLFDNYAAPTPWTKNYGEISFMLCNIERKMSTLTKARILQQLGQVTQAFTTSQMDAEVDVCDFDWMMLHLLVGIEVGKSTEECTSKLSDDGHRTVTVRNAVKFVFDHTSCVKQKKSSKQKIQ